MMRSVIANINEKKPRINRISWGGIIAGAFTIVSILFLLNLLGIGIGLTTVEPHTIGSEWGEIGISTIIWWTVSNIAAIFIGGMVAARMAGFSSNTDGGLHGFLAWAVYLVGAFIVFSSSVGFLFTGLDRSPGSNWFQINETDLSQRIEKADRDLSHRVNSIYDEVKKDYYRITHPGVYYESKKDKNDNYTSSPNVSNQTENRELSRLYPSQMYGSQNVDLYFNKPIVEGNRRQGYTIGTYRGEDFFDRPLFEEHLHQKTNLTDEQIDLKLNEWEKTIENNIASAEQFHSDVEDSVRKKQDQLADTAGKSGILMFVLMILGALAGFFGGALGAPEFYVTEEHHREQIEENK